MQQTVRPKRIARVRDAEKLKQGWIQDEDGNWIPPGWVRKDEAA